jgi:hypothetical protein
VCAVAGKDLRRTFTSMMTSTRPASPYAILIALRGPARPVACAAATIESFRTHQGSIDIRAVAAEAPFARSVLKHSGRIAAADIARVLYKAATYDLKDCDPELLLTRATVPVFDRSGITFGAFCNTLPVEQLKSLVAANPEINVQLTFRRPLRDRAWGKSRTLTIDGGDGGAPAGTSLGTP